MARINVGAPVARPVDPLEEEMKRLQRLQYMENVKRMGGKTWAEVAADFENEMEDLKKAEAATFRNSNRRGS